MKQNPEIYTDMLSELLNSIELYSSKSSIPSVQELLNKLKDEYTKTHKDSEKSSISKADMKSLFNDGSMCDAEKSMLNSLYGQPIPKYTPQYDIYETSDWYKLIISLPGVFDKNYCIITFNNDTLTVSSDSTYKHPSFENIINKTTNISYPKPFNVKLKVSSLIDTNKLYAELNNGLLSIKLFKIKQTKSNKDDINISVK